MYSQKTHSQEYNDITSQVFEKSLEGVMITDCDNKIVLVNQAFEDMTGFLLRDIRGLEANILKSGINDNKFYYKMWQRLNKKGSYRGEIWNRKKDGSQLACFLSIKVIYDENGDIKNYIAMYLDITTKVQNEEEIYKLAYHDILTKLPNRTRFNQYITTLLEKQEREPKPFALLFLDLDHFKYVNDTFGHNTGDLLLIKVGKIFKSILRKTDFIARLGGDEFTIVIENYESLQQIKALCTKIINRLKQQFIIKKDKFHIGCSIGVAIYDDDGMNQTTLLKHADTAMYKSKQNGKNRFTFHTQAMNNELAKKIELENGLKDALLFGEFDVYYQAKISLDTDTIQGAEALIRWNNPLLGVVGPDKFIAFSEEVGLINQVGDFVLNSVFDTMEKIKNILQNDNFVVSINISSLQLQERLFVERVKSFLETTQCDPNMIEFEITETIIMSNIQENIDKLLEIKKLGIKISIDDFGTGYSSMSYLQKLPIDSLKIDKSFIDNITDNGDEDILVNAIISLAKALKITTVAEGVEHSYQEKYLRGVECNAIQGFLYSKPLPLQDFLHYTEKFNQKEN